MLHLSCHEARAIIGVQLIALVNIHPAHGYRWSPRGRACAGSWHLAPHSLGGEKRQLDGSGRLHQIIPENLSSKVIPVAPTVPLLRAVHGSENFRIIVCNLDAEASVPEVTILSKFGGDTS